MRAFRTIRYQLSAVIRSTIFYRQNRAATSAYRRQAVKNLMIQRIKAVDVLRFLYEGQPFINRL